MVLASIYGTSTSKIPGNMFAHAYVSDIISWLTSIRIFIWFLGVVSTCIISAWERDQLFSKPVSGRYMWRLLSGVFVGFF